jgi:hypothetical protein
VTRNFAAIYQDLQKPRHRDADGNSPNRRAVRFKLDQAEGNIRVSF